MIREVIQYVVVCDSCEKKSGLHHDKDQLVAMVLGSGWESAELDDWPVAVKTIFRCPKCVKNRKFPELWPRGNE